jgi:glycine/serine hydroxymethyltransferase
MGKAEIKFIVELIDQSIMKAQDTNALQEIRKQVYALCEKFPIYSWEAFK